MKESPEPRPAPEQHKEEFKRAVTERVESLWQKYGWQCQSEIQFRDEPIRPGYYARVNQRPKSLNNPEDKFVLAVFTGKDQTERDSISKMLDWLIPHEVAHAVTETQKLTYTEPLHPDQHMDLEKSKHLKPEIFYSGANELATDVVAWRFAGDKLQQEENADSLAHIISEEVAKEKSGEYNEPFYRDQARFAALIDYIRQQGIPIDQDQRIKEAMDFWSEGRGKNFDADNQKRFDELVQYLQNTAKKAEAIEL